jgi:prevent-host-death family protein
VSHSGILEVFGEQPVFCKKCTFVDLFRIIKLRSISQRDCLIMNAEPINSKQAQRDFADNIKRVAYGHERLTITRHGKSVAALIPIEDLEFLEELEEQLDRKAIDEALAEQGEEPFTPLEDVKKELGLETLLILE